MNVFTWLLIGHLVGDWLLQNDWMARGKKQGLVTAPGLIHFAIYTSVVTIALWVSDVVEKSNGDYYICFGLLIFISHWLIDATNLVEGWIRFYGQSNLIMMRIMVDQTLHILVLAMLSTFLALLVT